MIVISVDEFRDVPILCKKDYYDQNEKGGGKQVLTAGACYVRSTHKPETTNFPSQTELRDLLNLALEKGARRFLKIESSAGLYPPTANIEFRKSDQELCCPRR